MDYQKLSQNDGDVSFVHKPKGCVCVEPRRRFSFSIIAVIVLETMILVSVITLLGITTSKASIFAVVNEKSSTHSARYGENSTRMSLKHEYDHLWNDFLLDDFGAVPEVEGIAEPRDSVVAISMFHQLHCLASFRKALQNAKEGKEIGESEKDNDHWPHCFDYMYQMIHCVADDTRERGSTEPGILGISGVETLRTCGDSPRLWDMVCDARQFFIEQGIVSPPLPNKCIDRNREM